MSTTTPKAGRTPVDAQPSTRNGTDAKNVLMLGFDWGTNTSCIKGSFAGSTDLAVNEVVPTLVGYAKEGIVNDLLPGNAKVLYGAQALKHRLHVSLISPMIDGVLKDKDAARDFALHLRSLIKVEPGTEIRAVIGVPANAEALAREDIREAVSGIFNRVLLVPEPFLAALGYRGDARQNDPSYVDPICNSLFVDIGAGTTDVCLIQGYYPTSNDQISFPFAGDKVDAMISQAVRQTYPDCDVSILKIREFKEKFSYVGGTAEPIVGTVMVAGKPRKLELTAPIGQACTELLQQILEAVKTLIGRTSSDSVTELLQNIILTGGGSRIRGLDVELQRLLTEEGYEQPVVKVVGEKYKEFVAKGALKAAQEAREDQWQQIVK